MKPLNKAIWIVLFSLAMGYLESAVVVYIRALYYPEGFAFPLKEMALNLAITELFREAATLIMIIAIGVLAARERLHRFAWFLVVFGIWDIAYYLFLKLLIGWPATLFTDDILFLLPTLWTGPVLAPVINSITMILLAFVILHVRKGSLPILRLTRREWILLLAGSIIILFTYMEDFTRFTLEYKCSLPAGELNWRQIMIILPSRFIPRSFNWVLFYAGVIMHFLAIFFISRRSFVLKKHNLV